jgi:hypothetical protein
MGQEFILQPQAFYSHVEFLSGDSLTAKNINTTTMLASALTAVSYVGKTFSSGSTGISAVFQGAFYGWGWDLDGVDKSQPTINTWVRANTSIATGFNILSANRVHSQFFGSTGFHVTSAVTISNNFTLGSATFHGVYYGDGWNLEGVDRSQPVINTWVRANTSIAIGFNVLSANRVHSQFFGSTGFHITSAAEINTNTALGSATFHGIFYGDGRRLLGSAFDQDVINSWVRANTAVAVRYTTLSADRIHSRFFGSTEFFVNSAAEINTNTALGSATFHGVYYGDGWNLEGVDRSQPVINSFVRQVTAFESPGITWKSNPSSTQNQWYTVAYGNGVFVTLSLDDTPSGSGNQAMTSSDGINWITNTVLPGQTKVWYSIAFGGGLFVAVGAGGVIATSVDGVNWIQRTPPFTNIVWTSVIYGDGNFVVVGQGANTTKSIYSKDGVIWTPATTSVGGAWTSVAYGNGCFIGVGGVTGANSIKKSTDGGKNWTIVAPPAGSPQDWTSVTYGNGLFVAVSQDGLTSRVMTSTDGNSWALQSTPLRAWSSVVYGNGIFVVFALTSNRLMTSSDGVTWTERLISAENNLWSDGAFGNGIFVGISQDGVNRVTYSGRQTSNNEPNTNIKHGDSVLYGNYTVSGTISSALSTSNSVSFVVEQNNVLAKRFLELSIIPQYTFTKNLTVSLGGTKTFGRYVNGDIILSNGKTVAEVLETALIEPITPVVSMTRNSSPAVPPFNTTTAYSQNLTTFYQICSLGSTVAMASAEFRRHTTGPFSTWTAISSVISNAPLSGTFTHLYIDPLSFSGKTTFGGATEPLQYRFTVTDTAGATRTVFTNISPADYSTPSLSPSLTPSATTRYRGDLSSTYSGTLTRNSANVSLNTYKIQRELTNGNSWTDITPAINITTNPASTAISLYHFDPATVNSAHLRFRTVYTDDFTSYLVLSPQVVTSSTTTNIVFRHKNAVFHSSNASLTVSDIDAVPLVGSDIVLGARLMDAKARGSVTNRILVSPTPTGSEYTYYVYAASEPDVSTIILDGATSIYTDTGGGAWFKMADVTGLNIHGATVTYKVYRTNSTGSFATGQTLFFT